MSEAKELLWLRRVRDLSQRLSSETDLRRLLPCILDAAIELIEAERGFLVRVHGRRSDGSHRIKVEVARGFDRAALSGTQNKVSRSVVTAVLERGGRGLVTTDAEDAHLVDATSVRARHVLSIACVPLRLRGEVLGVLYLDHRFVEGAFAADALPILESFASQAALALETAELHARAEGDAAPVAAEEPAPTSTVSGEVYGRLIGGSPPMIALYHELARAARSWAPLLLLGESGTGKALCAREVHARSELASQPFEVEPCAGAADALSTKLGDPAFLRRPGTLLLKEIADLGLIGQGNLLRALQRSAEHDDAPRRVIATTRHDLRARVEEGRFREDLYYRLDVLRIIVPPLRQRSADVALLFDQFHRRATSMRQTVSTRAMELLCGYTWPGNVRELENEVARLAMLGEERLSGQHLSPEIRDGRGVSGGSNFSGKTLDEVEQEMVRAALESSRGNKAKAARQLGIPRSTLYHPLDRYGLS